VKNTLQKKHTAIVKRSASRLGFDFCGISKAGKLDSEDGHLDEWLQRGFHGKMAYMAANKEKRLDPTLLVPGAKSVISLLYNYYPQPQKRNANGFKVARYAYGMDYHYVIKDKLMAMLDCLQREIGAVKGRVFVDSAPAMERQWAARSGLGWIGKNTLLLNRSLGSYFFIAELIVDIDLDADPPAGDYCGTCTRCLDACPTRAFAAPGVLDASKCISYLTIELKEEIPDSFVGKMNDWVFGCDICQEVCPWNRFAKTHDEPLFNMSDGVRQLMEQGRGQFSIDDFTELFEWSPIKRTKLKGLQRNIAFAKKIPPLAGSNK
jgi:epoxyqueuosine reductase